MNLGIVMVNNPLNEDGGDGNDEDEDDGNDNNDDDTILLYFFVINSCFCNLNGLLSMICLLLVIGYCEHVCFFLFSDAFAYMFFLLRSSENHKILLDVEK